MIADLYTFGLLVTVFTHDVWYAPAIAQLVILFFTYTAHSSSHESDDPWLAATALFSGAVWLGVAIGALATITFRLPRLVYVSVFYDEGVLRARGESGAVLTADGSPLNDMLVVTVANDTPVTALEGAATAMERHLQSPLAVRCDWRFYALTLSGLGLIVPWLFSLESIGARVALILTMSLLSTSVASAVFVLWLRRGTLDSSDRQFARGQMQFKYTIAMLVLWRVPAFLGRLEPPLASVVLPVVIAALYAAFVMGVRRILAREDTYLGAQRTSVKRTPALFAIVVGSLHASAYVVNALVQRVTEVDGFETFLGVALLFVAQALVLLIFCYFIDWDRWIPVQALGGGGATDDDDDDDNYDGGGGEEGNTDGIRFVQLDGRSGGVQ